MIKTSGHNVLLSEHSDRWSTLRHNRIGPCMTIVPTTDIHSVLPLDPYNSWKIPHSVQNVHKIRKISNKCFECFDCFNSPDDSWCIIYFSTPWNSKTSNLLKGLDRIGTDFTWINSQICQLGNLNEFLTLTASARCWWCIMWWSPAISTHASHAQ